MGCSIECKLYEESIFNFSKASELLKAPFASTLNSISLIENSFLIDAKS